MYGIYTILYDSLLTIAFIDQRRYNPYLTLVLVLLQNLIILHTYSDKIISVSQVERLEVGKRTNKKIPTLPNTDTVFMTAPRVVIDCFSLQSTGSGLKTRMNDD